MSKNGFTHLHLHSQYSLLDGAIAFDKLFKRCKALEMDSVAITDHGNMFGAVEFYTRARKANIKPIIGIESYIAPGSRLDKQKTSISDAAFHLILLAENNLGYQNLLKLASIGYTEGFYYRPRIDKEVLAQFNEGLIATSACLKGELASLFARGKEKQAYQAAEDFIKIFGTDRFFIELQTHEYPDRIETAMNAQRLPEAQVNEALIDLAAKLGLGTIVTNDVHFIEADDYEAHNCLCCISTGKIANDPTRMVYPPDIFLKSPEQMRQLFPNLQEAADNTLAIADRCNVEIDLKTRHAPSFKPPNSLTAEKYLTELVYAGAEKRYGQIDEKIKARIDRELDVIESKGFSSYFLINWDFCKYAHENDIPVGARGSGVGTVVGYCLGLCDVDPIKYDLLFERFMDPQRNEMPDIDIDICQKSRPEIIEYVRKKYGHVAQIITFGTMKARAVIRDICRVLNVPLSEADRLAKLIPESLGMTLDKAMKTEPQLKQAYDQNEEIRKVIDISKKLEGLTRHASVHAAGIVIADEPLTNFIPLYKPAGSKDIDIITQYEGPMVEKVGLLKMDFLGLKTLSVLQRAKQWVKTIHNTDIDLEALDLTDKKVLKIFSSGKTKGIFQFESGGMQDLLMKMKPDRLEDMIAANALYRPGPMILIPDYIDRKHGAKWSLPHPIMKEILEETYGIMIYQEQVMRICNQLGDIPLRQAYALIKAISKKKVKTIAREKERFVAGCVSKGLTDKQAEEIFDLIERFAGYGFNKSHSTRYAFIAYQTAYMKAHWPVEFMAALLTYEMGTTEKVVDYISECKEMDIEILPPDINESDIDFTPLYKRGKKAVIRFGLAAVKGVGEKALEQIIKTREKIDKFVSLFHFCENVDMRAANKQVLEALIKSGAFDRLGGNRAQMIAGLEKAMLNGSSLQADKQAGQMNFFGQDNDSAQYADDHKKLPNVAPWPEQQMLVFEKEVLGFYVTSNPLSHHAEMINIYSSTDSFKLKDLPDTKQIIIGGMITKPRYHITKKGRNAGSKMAVFILEDLQGTAEVVLFPDVLKKNADLLIEDTVIFVAGKVDCKREKPNIFATELIPLHQVTEKLAAKVKISLAADDITKEKIIAIKTICQHHRGKSNLSVVITTEKGKIAASADKALSVNPDVEFCKKIKQLVGQENFLLTK